MGWGQKKENLSLGEGEKRKVVGKEIVSSLRLVVSLPAQILLFTLCLSLVDLLSPLRSTIGFHNSFLSTYLFLSLTLFPTSNFHSSVSHLLSSFHYSLYLLLSLSSFLFHHSPLFFTHCVSPFSLLFTCPTLSGAIM